MYTIVTTKDTGIMKLYTSKAFRARFSECAGLADSEVIYIKRPCGRLLKLESVPQEDANRILDLLGPETERTVKGK